ncbi:hypothetical protein LguiB_026411 [Lonicera macranthoides]
MCVADVAQTDEGPTVPKFGDWDENDPTSGEGFTQVFELVRDEKNSARKAPLTSNASSSGPNAQNRRGIESSKLLTLVVCAFHGAENDVMIPE